VCIFLLPCLFPLSCPPCQVSEPFLHQSKEWPQEGGKRVPSVAKGSSALLDTSRFWHPAIGQSALERNYLEGLKNNQRKGARTMAACPPLAQLPLPRRKSRAVQSSCQLDQAGPFAFQPPGASLCWGSLQLTGRVSELDMHALWTKTQLSALTISFSHPGICPGGPCFRQCLHPDCRSSRAPRGHRGPRCV